MPDDLKERMKVVKQLTELFGLERKVYMGICILSLIILISSTVFLFLRDRGGYAELSLSFGSSGLITFSTGRLLYMWNEALKRLIPSTDQEDKKP
jgi:hypothetical protein